MGQTWTGASSTTISDAGNWGGALPYSGTVTIPNGCPRYPESGTLSLDGSNNGLEIGSAARIGPCTLVCDDMFGGVLTTKLTAGAVVDNTIFSGWTTGIAGGSVLFEFLGGSSSIRNISIDDGSTRFSQFAPADNTDPGVANVKDGEQYTYQAEALEGTYDPMAAAVFPETDEVDGGVEYGPTGDDYEGTGVNAQALAKQQYGVSGTVWHVAVGGDDGDDGLSWATAKASPKTVIEAATAGDLVLLGAGTFALGNAAIATPDGVSLFGAGLGVSVITSAKAESTPLVPIVRTPSNGILRGLTIRGTLTVAQGLQVAVGCGAGQTACSNATVEECELDANDHAVGLDAENATLMVRQCVLRGQQDSAAWSNASGAVLTIEDSAILTQTPLTGACAAGGAMGNNGGTAIVLRCTIDTNSADGFDVYGLNAANGGKVFAFDTSIRTASATGLVYSVMQSDTAYVATVNCAYDRTKTFGTINDIAVHATDGGGNALAVAAKQPDYKPLVYETGYVRAVLGSQFLYGGPGATDYWNSITRVAVFNSTTAYVNADVNHKVGATIAAGDIATDAITAAAVKADAAEKIADATLDGADGVETGVTVRKALQRIGAVIAGLSSGAGTGTEAFVGLDGVTARVRGTVDNDGNRTSVTYDPEDPE